MRTTTTHNTITTNDAGFPPAPSEAHQRSVVQRQTREVVMNGSRIVMKHDGRQWWNVKVSAA